MEGDNEQDAGGAGDEQTEVETPAEGEQGEPAEGGENQAEDGAEGEAKPKVDAKPKPPPAKAEEEPEPRETAARVALRQRERQIEEREAKTKLSEADAAELAELREIRKAAKADPIGYLEAGGVTPEDIFKAAKEGRAPMDPAVRKALAEVEAIKKRDAEREKRDAEARDSAAKAERDTKVKAGLTQFLKEKADTYELTASKGPKGVQAMIDVAVKYQEKYGRLPKLEQLAERVEKAYEDDLKASLATKKAKALGKPKVEAKPAGDEDETTSLNNDLDAVAKPPPPKLVEPGRSRTKSHSEEVSDLWEEIKRERRQKEADGHG